MGEAGARPSSSRVHLELILFGAEGVLLSSASVLRVWCGVRFEGVLEAPRCRSFACSHACLRVYLRAGADTVMVFLMLCMGRVCWVCDRCGDRVVCVRSRYAAGRCDAQACAALCTSCAAVRRLETVLWALLEAGVREIPHGNLRQTGLLEIASGSRYVR